MALGLLETFISAWLVVAVLAQQLPVNFEYKRETGQETGLPYFTLTPRREAMAYDAARGSTFEALGAMVQPEAAKYGLIFYNAKESHQLHLQKEKGVLLKVDGEEFRIPEYTVHEQTSAGRLKFEGASIVVNGLIFWKLATAKDVFIRVGTVAYSLDEDNIEALHYFAEAVARDVARRRESKS
jgi:hypothetical protein